MHTSTQRSTRTRKPAATPLSTTAAKLIEQIQAEARDKLLTELSAKDAIVVLHGFDVKTKRVRVRGDTLRVSDDLGNEVRMYRSYEEPESWRKSEYMVGHWHPARWYGSQTMVDGNGIEWTRELHIHICDDFGNLVQVAE